MLMDGWIDEGRSRAYFTPETQTEVTEEFY